MAAGNTVQNMVGATTYAMHTVVPTYGIGSYVHAFAMTDDRTPRPRSSATRSILFGKASASTSIGVDKVYLLRCDSAKFVILVLRIDLIRLPEI